MQVTCLALMVGTRKRFTRGAATDSPLVHCENSPLNQRRWAPEPLVSLRNEHKSEYIRNRTDSTWTVWFSLSVSWLDTEEKKRVTRVTNNEFVGSGITDRQVLCPLAQTSSYATCCRGGETLLSVTIFFSIQNSSKNLAVLNLAKKSFWEIFSFLMKVDQKLLLFALFAHVQWHRALRQLKL